MQVTLTGDHMANVHKTRLEIIDIPPYYRVVKCEGSNSMDSDKVGIAWNTSK